MAGASFVLNSRVQSLLMADGYVKGVNIKQADGAEEKVYSKIVLDAEGVSSRLLRQAGLKALKPSGLVYAVEAEVENVQDVELDAVEVYFGKAYAPGFYGWLIPRPDGSAKVGLATNHGDPREYLKTTHDKASSCFKTACKSQNNTGWLPRHHFGWTNQQVLRRWFSCCRRLRFTS